MFINLVMTKSNFETIESHSLFVYHLYDLHKHQMILRTSVGQNRLFSNVSRNAYFNTSKNKIKKILLKKRSTVKPVYNYHPRDPKFVAVVDRLLFFRGSFMLYKGKMGLQNGGRCR